MTLIEMLVSLALLGLLIGVSTVAVVSLRPRQEMDEVLEMRKARVEAIQTGIPRTANGVLFLPDGRGVGAHVDPLTGMPREK